MEIFYFFIENFDKITSNDLKFIRSFYLPIIGPFSTVLYEYLSDLEQKDSAYKPGINIDELSRILFISVEDVISAKKNLEAVGLIKSFAKNDNKSGLITMLKPLSFEKFINNNILKSNLVKKIGEISFEKLVMSNKPRLISKNEYIETSAKYFDIFDYSFKKEDEEYETSDLKLPSFDNKIDAAKSLTPNQYIKFLGNSNMTFGEKEYINYARNIGLSDRSINTIIDYSYERNGRIVVNFVKKITNDFYERNITTFKEITDTLTDSIKSKKQSKYNKELDWGHLEDTKSKDNSNTKEISLNDLLEDLKELM